MKASLLHKEKKDTALLHAMPILYKKGPETIAPKEEANEVFVWFLLGNSGKRMK